MIPRKWGGEINLQFAASTRECSVKNGGPQRGVRLEGREGRSREWSESMKLVLAGTEITSLISIKECEGPLYPLSLLPLPSPFLHFSAPSFTLHPILPRVRRSPPPPLSFSPLPRGAPSFVSISRSSSYLVRDFATQHTLSTLLVPSRAPSS